MRTLQAAEAREVNEGRECGRALDEMDAQRVRAPKLGKNFYRRPCDRK
jgi:hypothetical protein